MPYRKNADSPYIMRSALGRGSDPSLIDSTQRLYVSAYGSAATLRCLEKNRRGGWENARQPDTFRGFVGRRGVTVGKRELDGCTPAGLYRLDQGFGTRPRPDTRMPWRDVTPESFWVDDPNSPYYNTWVETAACGGWSSAEHLIDYPAEYAYAVVVEYNTNPILPGKGSAIFLHCGAQATSGCIAVRESDLLKILEWLDPEKSPSILIAPPRSP